MAEDLKLRLSVSGTAEVQAGVNAAAASVQKLGVSAAQTAAALRNVPAQFTDIITALQGGQAPLTVLLQQGGQLKDMFGGIGPAARALSGYVAGLVSPYTAAAAAAGGLGLAYYKGAEEAREFERTLIATGRAAGVTSGQLADISAALGRMAGGTTGKAAEALNLMASSGLAGAANLKLFAGAALEFERAGGQAADKTAAAFVKLGDAPVAASAKLNESMNYLTVSTYEQIKALEEQGNHIDAANLAQRAFADTLTQRAPEMEAQLGLIDKAWRGVKESASGAWDAIKNIGRGDTLGDQIAALEQQATNLRKAIAIRNPAFANPGQMASALFGGQSFADQLKDIEAVIAKLRESQQVQAGAAKLTQEQAAQTKLLIDYRKDETKSLTESQRLQREITRIVVEGVRAGEAMEKIQARVAAARKPFDATASAVAAKATEEQSDLLAKLSGITSTYNNELAALDKTLAKGLITEEQYGKAVRDLVASQPFAVNGAKDMAEQAKAYADAVKETAKAEADRLKDLDKALEGQDRELQGLRDKYVELTAGKTVLMDQVTARREDALAAAEQALAYANLDEMSGAEYERRLQIIAKLREEIALRKGVAAATASGEVEEANRKAADKAAADWQRVSDQIGQSLSDALMDGGKSAADYIEGLFRNMVLRPIIQGYVQDGMATVFGGGTASTSQSANNIASMYSAGQRAYGWVTGGTTATAYTAAATATPATATAAYGGAAAEIAGGSTAGAGAAGLSSTGWGALVVLAALAVNRANRDYDKGFDRESARDTGTIAGYVSAGTSDILSKLGVNDQVADFFGATAVAGTIGRGRWGQTGQGITGSFGKGDFSGQAYADMHRDGGLLRSDQNRTDYTQLDSALASFMSDAAAGMKAKVAEWGAALSLPVDALEGVTQDAKIAFTGDFDADLKAITTAIDGYGAALVESWGEALKPVALFGESTMQTVERVGIAIASTNEVLKLLNVPLLATSVAGGQAAAALAETFGGLDKLAQASSAYYNEFFTEGEKAAKSTAMVTEALATVGLAMPDSRDAFRAAVEGLNLTTEADRERFTVLMSVAGAFAELNPVLESTARTAEQMAESFKSAMKSLAGDTSSLEVELLSAMGNSAGAKALQRSQYLGGLSSEVSPEQLAAIAGVYDYNEALRSQIQALNDATEAERARVERELAVAGEREGLERQKLELLGDTAAIRALEREALDASNRALYDEVKALEDQAVATDAARVAAEKAAQQQAALAQAIDANIGKFLTEDEQRVYAYQKIADSLTAVGLAGVTLEGLMGATKAEIYSFTEGFLTLADVSDEVKLAVVNAAGGLADLAGAGNEAAKSLASAAARMGATPTAGNISSSAQAMASTSNLQASRAEALAKIISGGYGASYQAAYLESQARGWSAATKAWQQSSYINRALMEDELARANRSPSAGGGGGGGDSGRNIWAERQQKQLDALQQQYDGTKDLIDSLDKLRVGLDGFKQDLLGSALDPSNPALQYETERMAVESLARQAMAGDAAAVDEFQAQAQEFLTLSKSYNASSQAYATDWSRVLELLDKVASSIDKQTSTANATLAVQQSGLSKIAGSTAQTADATATSARTARVQAQRSID